MFFGLLFFGLLCSGLSLQSHAKPSASVKYSVKRVESDQRGEYLVLPYAFASESMGFNAGVGFMKSSFIQEQMTVGATAFGGNSRALAAGIWNFRIPYSERFYFSALGLTGHYPQLKAYAIPSDIYLPADYPRPGSNNSSKDDFVATEGDSSWSEMKLEYTLPMGTGKQFPFTQYTTRGGLLASEPSGGSTWNPLRSGVSVINLRHVYRHQKYINENYLIDESASAFELGFLYDNTDFPVNPSFGSSQYFSYMADSSRNDDSEHWRFYQFDASKYYSLGESKSAKQRVLAFNGWLGASPSWKNVTNSEGHVRPTGAPYFSEGATLGGYNRMKGYPMNRFHDKYAIYGSVEYRHTLNWNPLTDMPIIHFFNIDFIQLVGFAEAGRVAGEFNTDIISDIKSDVGAGIRIMASGIIVRLDTAFSNEGGNFWLMVSQPF